MIITTVIMPTTITPAKSPPTNAGIILFVVSVVYGSRSYQLMSTKKYIGGNEMPVWPACMLTLMLLLQRAI